jgi:hypothetical protein
MTPMFKASSINDLALQHRLATRDVAVAMIALRLVLRLERIR